MNRAFDRDRIRTSRRVGAIFSLIAVLLLVWSIGSYRFPELHAFEKAIGQFEREC